MGSIRNGYLAATSIPCRDGIGPQAGSLTQRRDVIKSSAFLNVEPLGRANGKIVVLIQTNKVKQESNLTIGGIVTVSFPAANLLRKTGTKPDLVAIKPMTVRSKPGLVSENPWRKYDFLKRHGASSILILASQYPIYSSAASTCAAYADLISSVQTALAIAATSSG